jgi:hypothetical protein
VSFLAVVYDIALLMMMIIGCDKVNVWTPRALLREWRRGLAAFSDLPVVTHLIS